MRSERTKGKRQSGEKLGSLWVSEGIEYKPACGGGNTLFYTHMQITGPGRLKHLSSLPEISREVMNLGLN